MTEHFLQYVVSPLVIAVVAGIGWLTKNYLQAIRGQVEDTDQDTSLRTEVTQIKEAVEKHEAADQKLAGAIHEATAALTRIDMRMKAIEGTCERIEDQAHARMGRIENRLDRHLDKDKE